MTSEMDEGVVCYSIDSDALIAKGLIGLLLDVLNRVPPEEILKADLYFIAKTGLESHLSPQRANGLTSIVLHMKESASSYVHPGRGPSVH
jgi:cysteine desulfuration protein SufE